MDGRGPNDTPPFDRFAPQPDEPPAEAPLRPRQPGPVLSLEERKAARAAQRRAREAVNGGAYGRTPGEGPGAAGPRLARAVPRPYEPDSSPEDRPFRAPDPAPLPQTAGPARARGRHVAVLLSFLMVVVLPTAAAAWYLWERAAPRYVSSVGFSVRTEDHSSAMELLGGMMALGQGSSSDTDVLYRFIQSQEIVRAVDDRLDLRTMWAKGDPEVDPIFAFHPPGTIEDLHDHWERMVAVYNDGGTGLLDVQVQAFTPEDARAIAQAVYEESQSLVNRLSSIAQEDTTRLAREELAASVERLKTARAALTRFRNETQIVDPQTSLQSQMGLLSQLEQQLAQALIELDLLRQGSSADDPRISEAQARVDVIEARMDEERAKLGLGRPGDAAVDPEGDPGLAPRNGTAFADLVGQYEGLMVDQEFAQQAYVAALAAYDAALAESRHQSRYLAAHVEPTLAERADLPDRWSMTLLTALFGLLAWVMLTLMGYALRDRR